MTPRSPIPQPKTSTISRRLRTRADQHLSIQPPELPQVRNLRSRRAATLPSPQSTSGNYHPQEIHTPLWDPTDILDPFTRSGHTSHLHGPSGTVEEPPPVLSHPTDRPPLRSPHQSPSALVALDTHDTRFQPEQYHPNPTPDSDLLPSPLPSVSGGQSAADFHLHLSPDPEHPQDSSLELQDMSTLGFMMPAQYDLGHYGSPPTLETPNFAPMPQHSYSDSRPSPPQPQTSGSFAPAYTSSPSLNQTEPRRSGDHILPPYQPTSVPRSPYQQPLGPMRGSPTPMAYSTTASEASTLLSSASHSYPYPAIHTNIPGQNLNTLGSNNASYPPPPIYPPSSYEMNGYNSLPATVFPNSSTAAAYSSYDSTGLAPPPPGLSSSPGSQGNGVMPRVLNSRPKPQCWEHGCNGRQFSTFSNLLRHQREKSGTAAKSYCPRCGAEFTRTTARNGHLAHEKCKPRRTSDTSR